MSEAIVRLQRKGQMVIPRAIREEIGISEGTLLKVAVKNGHGLTVTPQVAVSRRAKDRKDVFRQLAIAVDELRADAKAKGLDKMSMAEINRAVAAMRRDMKNGKTRGRG